VAPSLGGACTVATSMAPGAVVGRAAAPSWGGAATMAAPRVASPRAAGVGRPRAAAVAPLSSCRVRVSPSQQLPAPRPLEADAEGGPRASPSSSVAAWTAYVPKAASSAGAAGAPSPPRRVRVSPWPLAANAEGDPRASSYSSMAGRRSPETKRRRTKETKRRETEGIRDAIGTKK
jgi:hypothetical protein